MIEIDYVYGVENLRYLTGLNDENLAKEVLESNTVQNALLELLNIKTRINHEIVYCDKCRHADFSKTIDYAYACKNRKSPCRNRLVGYDFGCVYGEKNMLREFPRENILERGNDND